MLLIVPRQSTGPPPPQTQYIIYQTKTSTSINYIYFKSAYFSKLTVILWFMIPCLATLKLNPHHQTTSSADVHSHSLTHSVFHTLSLTLKWRNWKNWRNRRNWVNWRNWLKWIIGPIGRIWWIGGTLQMTLCALSVCLFFLVTPCFRPSTITSTTCGFLYSNPQIAEMICEIQFDDDESELNTLTERTWWRRHDLHSISHSLLNFRLAVLEHARTVLTQLGKVDDITRW